MLQDFIYHQAYIKKQIDDESERCARTGEPFNLYLHAVGRVWCDVDASSIDTVLAGLQRSFSRARAQLQRRKTDDNLNDAVMQLNAVSEASRILLENVYFENGKIAETREGFEV